MTDHTRCMRPASLVERDTTDDQHYVWDGGGYLPVTIIQRGFYEETYVESQQEYGGNPPTPGDGVDLYKEYERTRERVEAYGEGETVPGWLEDRLEVLEEEMSDG